MERNKLLLADYLDIIFDGRNKAYGGYELRSRYAYRARKATMSVILGVALAAAVPLIADALTSNEIVARPVVTVTKLCPLDVPKPIEQSPIHIVDPPPPVVTIHYVVPRIVENDEITEAPPTIDEVRDVQVSLETSDGPLSATGIIPTGPTGGGSRLVETPQPPKEVPLRIVEQMPEFEGDLAQYLRKNLRYPQMAQEAGIAGNVGVQFVVNEDGSISNVEIVKKVASSLDAEAARVVNGMPRWKPGKQQGKAVKVYFILPINFVLE
jgi:periplasmic protein TonB